MAIIDAYKSNPIYGTLLLGTFLVLKGFVLSKGDIPVALGILREAGLSTVVIGGLLSGLPILVASMLTGTVWHWIARKPDEKRKINDVFPFSPLSVVLVATVMLSVVFTQWPVFAAAAVIGFLMGWINQANVWVRRFGYLAVLLIGIFAAVSMLYTVWLPHEKVTITGVNPPPVGYVLADDPGGWLTMLVSGKHLILYYPDKNVTAREVCERAPSNGLSQVEDAATLWQEITKWSLLRSLHPVLESC